MCHTINLLYNCGCLVTSVTEKCKDDFWCFTQTSDDSWTSNNCLKHPDYPQLNHEPLGPSYSTRVGLGTGEDGIEFYPHGEARRVQKDFEHAMAHIAEQSGWFKQGEAGERETETNRYQQRGTQTDGQSKAATEVGQPTETVANSVQASDSLRPTPSKRGRGRQQRATPTKSSTDAQGSARSERVSRNTRVDVEPEVFQRRLRSGRER